MGTKFPKVRIILLILLLWGGCTTGVKKEKEVVSPQGGNYPSVTPYKGVSKEKKAPIVEYPLPDKIKRFPSDLRLFESFLKELKEDPTLAVAHYNIGVLYMKYKKYSLAEKAFEEALKIRPDYVEGAVDLANTYRILGKLGAAEAIIRRLLREHPSDVRLIQALAIVYREKGKLDESLNLSLKVLEIDQKYLPARINVGLVYLLKKKYAMAYYVFDTSKDIDPNNPAIHEYKGYTLYYLGDLDGAEKEFNKALKSRPKKPELYVNLAVVMMKKDKWAEAEKYLEKALKLNPLSADVHLNLGVVYLKLGKLKEAYRELKTALKYGADKATVYYNLGLLAVLYRKKPKLATKKAIEYFHKYLASAVNIGTEEKKEVENMIKDIQESGVEVVYLYSPKFKMLPAYARPSEGGPTYATEYGHGATSSISSSVTSTTVSQKQSPIPPPPSSPATSPASPTATTTPTHVSTASVNVTSSVRYGKKLSGEKTYSIKNTSPVVNYPVPETGQNTHVKPNLPKAIPVREVHPSAPPAVTSPGSTSVTGGVNGHGKRVVTPVKKEIATPVTSTTPRGKKVETVTPTEESPSNVEEVPEEITPER